VKNINPKKIVKRFTVLFFHCAKIAKKANPMEFLLQKPWKRKFIKQQNSLSTNSMQQVA